MEFNLISYLLGVGGKEVKKDGWRDTSECVCVYMYNSDFWNHVNLLHIQRNKLIINKDGRRILKWKTNKNK